MNIIEMAREAGFDVDEGLFPFEASEDKYIGTEIVLERFAALVAAHEREKQVEGDVCACCGGIVFDPVVKVEAKDQLALAELHYGVKCK